MSRRHLSRLAGMILLVWVAAVGGHKAGDTTKVTFRKGAELRLPEFALTDGGDRPVASGRFPRGFLFHDFRVTRPMGVQSGS